MQCCLFDSMNQRQVFFVLAFLAAACLADVSKPDAIRVDIFGPQKPETPVTYVVKNQTDVRADKKAMIDFSSEFADNGGAEPDDDLQEEDQSEMALEKEEADYDDEEILSQDMEDDNDVEDLSGGESMQTSGEELSFEDDDEGDSQSYEDYDPDEDSAADDDSEGDNSNASFTEADDEQVMSDVSSINDYKDDDGESEDAGEADENGGEEGEEKGEGDENEGEGDENEGEGVENDAKEEEGIEANSRTKVDFFISKNLN